jgi:hypothetical protein
VLKKTITYKSFDGEQEFTEDFYFHLSKAELVELETSRPGGLSEWVKQIVKTEDVNQIVPEFKKLLLMTYGKRSDDGRRFIKNQQLRDEFASTEAFSELFIELVSDADKAAAFVNGILPSGLEEQVAKMEREPNRAERRHPETISETVGDIAPGESRNIFEQEKPEPIALTRVQLMEMDTDELKDGLATGRFVIAPDPDL